MQLPSSLEKITHAWLSKETKQITQNILQKKHAKSRQPRAYADSKMCSGTGIS